ncbi:MAG: class I SAM-dependent methyltransferase [Candidatus Thorarchaeota archaeon]
MSENTQKFKTWGILWDVLAQRLVNLIGITEGATVLDVGTGGGSTLLAALERVGPSGKVIGVDKEPEWVEHVNSEIERCNCTGSKVHLMDATEMSFPDNHFDFVISGFMGWKRHFDFMKIEFTGPNRVMQEIVRVLKPSGKVGISTWLFQEDTEWMEDFVNSYSHPAKRTYSKENIEGWEKIIDNSGLIKTSVLHESVEIPYSSVDAWWDEMMSYDWKSQILELSDLKDIPVEVIKKAAFDQVEPHRSGDEVCFVRRVLYALGCKE